MGQDMMASKRFGGPPKREARAGERVALSLRMTPDLKRRLDESAEAGGRSQSQEAEVRLEKSFERESLLPEVLSLAYGPQLAGILMLLGAGMEDVAQRYVDRYRRSSKSFEGLPWDAHWTEVAEAFEVALIAAETLLTALRPDRDRMKHARWKEYPFRPLPELMRAVRRGSKRSSPHFTTPRRDVNTIRLLLGPIADTLTEAKLEKAGQNFDTQAGARSDVEAQLRTKITATADAVLNLMNSSPRSPSRQQLAELVQKHLLSEDKQVSQEGGGHG
jgi:hypothetical protein